MDKGNYTELLKFFKELVMKLPAWRLIWLSLTGLTALLICKPDIIRLLSELGGK